VTPSFLVDYKYVLVNERTGTEYARIAVAISWWEKGVGVIPLANMPSGVGLWLPGVTSVHTWFVRFPLDLLFLDSIGGVVRFVPAVRSWTTLVSCSRAAGLLELGAGTLNTGAAEAKVGEKWILRPIRV